MLFLIFQLNFQYVMATDVYDSSKESVRSLEKGNEGHLLTPEGLTVISDRAYANNIKITRVVVADGVKTIGREAFAGCVNLRYIFLPKSVENLGKDVFKDCPRCYKDSDGIFVCAEIGISRKVLDQLYDQELEVQQGDEEAKDCDGGQECKENKQQCIQELQEADHRKDQV